MMDLTEFRRIEREVAEMGYAGDVTWSENIRPPSDPDEFAREAIFVICNSGMRFIVAQGIFARVMVAIGEGKSARTAFGHPGKASAIDDIWERRADLLAGYLAAVDKPVFCESLPWIGGITKYHLAKNLGADVAKPDVHLQRLADSEGCTAQELCNRLAGDSGYRSATVDVVLWRACAIGVIDSRRLLPTNQRDPA